MLLESGKRIPSLVIVNVRRAHGKFSGNHWQNLDQEATHGSVVTTINLGKTFQCVPNSRTFHNTVEQLAMAIPSLVGLAKSNAFPRAPKLLNEFGGTEEGNKLPT